MARLPTKQSELSILRSFANMPDDVMSGTPSDYVTRAILPKANDFSARGPDFGTSGMPPFNNSPILDQALSSGLPFRQAAQAAGNIAGTNVKSEMDNVVRAAQDTPESRAMSAAAEIMKKYPGAAIGLTSLMPYEIVLDKYASSFGIDKEDIERAIGEAKSRADETAFPDIPIEYAPITGTPKLTPKSSFNIPAPQTDSAIGIPATFMDQAILDPEGAAQGMDYWDTPSHVGLSDSEQFEALARRKLGTEANQPGRLDAVQRGMSHARGMWLFSLLKNGVSSSTLTGQDDYLKGYKDFEVDRDIAQSAEESFYNYLKGGKRLNEDDPDVERYDKAFRKASNVAYDLGSTTLGLQGWDADNEFADLSADQKGLIGLWVTLSVRGGRGYEQDIVNFKHGRTGRGALGKFTLQASDATHEYWQNQGIRMPEERATGFIDFYENTKEKSGKKVEQPVFSQGG